MSKKNQQFVVDWARVNHSLEEKTKFHESELQPNKNKNPNFQSFSLKSLYTIKNLDLEKQRFSEDTFVSKRYEKALENNLLEWAKLFKINIDGIE